MFAGCRKGDPRAAWAENQAQDSAKQKGIFALELSPYLGSSHYIQGAGITIEMLLLSFAEAITTR